jgi:Ni/Co efflux regulator RcnB
MKKLLAMLVASTFVAGAAYANDMKKADTKKTEAKSEMKKADTKSEMKKADTKSEMKKADAPKADAKK